MNRTEKRILEFIGREKPVKLKNIAALLDLGVTQSSVQVYVSGLIKAGYVNPPRYTLTKKGKEVMQEALKEALLEALEEDRGDDDDDQV